TSGLIRHYDDTHNWVSFPRQMIEQRAREVLLHESKGSMRISGYPSDLPTSLRLKIHLLRFEEVRDDVESQGNAVVAIEYVLHLRNPSGSGWIQVGPKRITATAPIRHDILFRNFDPYTFSLGMRQAANKALTELFQDIVEVWQTHSLPPKKPLPLDGKAAE
ncbi:MAG: hypothetical protein QF752_02265, partial [Planctomycetota bacterium]|nr:hypothetical protein [Planctomycetota bacterium]